MAVKKGVPPGVVARRTSAEHVSDLSYGKVIAAFFNPKLRVAREFGKFV